MERCAGFASWGGGVPFGTSCSALVLGQCGRESEQRSVNMSVHELAAQGRKRQARKPEDEDI